MKKLFVFFSFAVLFVIFFLEVLLSVLSFSSPKIKKLLAAPWTATSPYILDQRLGKKPNPEFQDHDSNGFRNPKALHAVDIVALGDSQTYGTGVRLAETWPRQLEISSREKVYNMAFGGFGPAHSLVLWDQAVKLKPKIIIEAIYSGNDLYDCFHLVYDLGQLPELKTSDLIIQNQIKTLEQTETITARVEQLLQSGRSNFEEESIKQQSFFKKFISDYSKLYGLLRRAQFELGRYQSGIGKNFSQELENQKWVDAKKFANDHLEFCEVYEDGPFKTIFTPKYRQAALDLQDLRIQEGRQILLKAIQKMHEFGAAQRIRFFVVLIPTKELVFGNLVKNPSQGYRVFIESEKKFWQSMIDFLKENKIEYVDALPALEGQLLLGKQPYQVSSDGHPNSIGHKAIAEFIKIYIEGMQ